MGVETEVTKSLPDDDAQQPAEVSRPRWGGFGRRRREQWFAEFGKMWEGGQVWQDVRTGVGIDIEQMKKEGKSPEEFWGNVWTDMHKEGYKGPGVYNKAEFEEKGQSIESVWDNRMQVTEDTPTLLWIPMMQRWQTIGAGQNREKFRSHMLEAMEKRHVDSLPPELKEKFYSMKEEKKEEEFWKTHWNEIHKDALGRPRSWMFQGPPDGEGGNIPPEWAYGRRGAWCRRNRRRKAEVDDEPIYKEFDFS